MKISELDRVLRVDSKELFAQDKTSSRGDQSKWVRDNLFIKADCEGEEGLAETVISDLLGFSSLSDSEYIKYKTCKIYNKYENKYVSGCVSELFVDGDFEIITFARVFDLYGSQVFDTINSLHFLERYKFIVEFFKTKFNLDLSNYIKKCITIDAVFLNPDRHLHNLAVLSDGKGKLKECPIFDNGMSICSNSYDKFRFYTGVSMTDIYNSVRPKEIFGEYFLEEYRRLCPEPPITFDKEKVLCYLDFNKDRLDFRGELIRMSMCKYPELFVERSLDLTTEETSFF